MRLPTLALALAFLTVSFAASDSRGAPAPSAPATPASTLRMTARTPEAMVAAARARATAPDAVEGDVLSSALVIAQLANDVPARVAPNALEAIANAPGNDATREARRDVAVLARTLAGDEGTADGVAADRRAGIVTDLALLGPFRDTGGGLRAPLGPEEPGRNFTDDRADYSWGSFQVRWRTIPPTYASARGVPLDLFVHPRKESCSFVATNINVDAKRTFVVRLAATGQAKLTVDGVTITSEDGHASAIFDRLAIKIIDAEPGDHLVVAKTCSAALDDDGRVRIRITDEQGQPLVLKASATLAGKPAPRPRTSSGPTALERVVNTSSIATPALLASATVRTLGGADDLKSPKAPGMLDAITQDKKLDADRLAFAAWITPSAANRTGWYGRALERAGVDVDVTAFVRRALVEERLAGGQLDWAYAGARAAGLDKDKDDDAVAIMNRLAGSLGSEAVRATAFRAIAARTAKLDEASTSVLDEIATGGRAFDPALGLRASAVAASRAGEGRGERMLRYIIHLSDRDRAKTREVAKLATTGALEDVDRGLAVASALRGIGELDMARDVLGSLVWFAPNRAEVAATYAEALLAAPPKNDPKSGERATAFLRRARELAPGEARYRAELALRTPKSATETAPTDERHLVASEEILKRRRGAPRPGEAADVRERQLHWLRAVRMHPDKRVSQLIHYAREIVIGPRSQEELYENLPLEGDLIEILRARVHRKDGTLTFPLEEHNEGTRPRVRWPELSPGDTVEIAIRTWTAGPVGGRGDPPFYFLDYAGSIATNPILFNAVIVESTKEKPIFVDVVNPDPNLKRTESDDHGLHSVRLEWTKPVTLPEEPLSPQLTELVPVVVGSTFRTWDDFRAWYTEAVRGFTDPDQEVRRLAAELTKGKTTREAKLKAIFEFVSDQIRYVNYTSGEFWLPNRPHQLLARREGDCDDKAILLITLLRAVGIEAQEVLVQTRETGQPSVLRAKNAAAPLFDHGIAFLPGPNGGQYLDATSPQSRLGPLPAMDARASALRVVGGGPDPIVELPAGQPESHGSDVDWTLTISPSGGGTLQGTEEHSGDSAFYLRTYLAQEGARSSYVENNLLSPWVPTVEVDGAIDFAGDLPGGRARVKYKAKSDALARREGTELVVPLSPNRTMASQLAPLVKRTLPVSMPSHMAPTRQRRTLHIVAPAGFDWGDLPAGGKVEGGDFGRAELEIAPDPKNKRAIIAKRTVLLDRHVIPPEKYVAWREFLKRIDALMNRGVRLVPSGGAK